MFCGFWCFGLVSVCLSLWFGAFGCFENLVFRFVWFVLSWVSGWVLVVFKFGISRAFG